MTESRLIDIETKLAYQEDTLLKLNDIVCEQQQQIQKLEQTNRLLIERFRELTTTDQEQNIEQPPPHY
jgi:SlyX protein